MSKKSFSFISLAAFIFVASITFDSLSHADDYKNHHEKIECHICFNDVLTVSNFEIEDTQSNVYIFELNAKRYLLAISFQNFLTRAPPQK